MRTLHVSLVVVMLSVVTGIVAWANLWDAPPPAQVEVSLHDGAYTVYLNGDCVEVSPGAEPDTWVGKSGYARVRLSSARLKWEESATVVWTLAVVDDRCPQRVVWYDRALVGDWVGGSLVLDQSRVTVVR